VQQLVRRYFDTRSELARLFGAVAALPMDAKPVRGTNWQTEVSLGELQARDDSLAVQVTRWVNALESDAEAPFPPPSPQPQAEAA
jgi:hypothetical protein